MSEIEDVLQEEFDKARREFWGKRGLENPAVAGHAATAIMTIRRIAERIGFELDETVLSNMS